PTCSVAARMTFGASRNTIRIFAMAGVYLRSISHSMFLAGGCPFSHRFVFVRHFLYPCFEADRTFGCSVRFRALSRKYVPQQLHKLIGLIGLANESPGLGCLKERRRHLSAIGARQNHLDVGPDDAQLREYFVAAQAR